MSRYRPSRNYVSGDSELDGDVTVSGSLDVTKNLDGIRRYLLDDAGDGLGWGGEVGETWTIYIDSNSGNDLNDGLTAATALKTVKKSIERIPTGIERYDSQGLEQAVTVHVASGTYVFPTEMEGVYNTQYLGATSSFDSATVHTTISGTDETGLIVDATFSKEYDEDELRATMIHWGDPAVIGLGAKNGWIYANESGSGGITRCYICHRDGATYTDANPIKLVRSDVTFEIPEVPPHVGYTDTSVQFNSELTFQYITFDGAVTASPKGSSIYAGANQKATFTYCKFGRDNDPQFLKLQVNQGFTLIVGGYIQPLNKNKAGLSIGAQGYANTRACVIDGRYAGSNAGARVTLDGIISPNQEIIFRDADFGFATQGGVSTWDKGSTSPHCLRFVEFTGSATCINGVRANTDAADQYGGVLDLPHLYGRVSADYGVTAINGAQVHMGAESALTSALGINFVSADGGISNVSQTQYLTTISGGNVPFTGYETIYSASTPGDWIAPAPSSSQEAIDRIAALVESIHGAIP